MPNAITLSWTPQNPEPAGGYRIKYWPTSNPANITTVSPNVTGSMYTITGLVEGSYAGTIEADCGGGFYSTPVNWNAAVAGPTYYYYTGILCGGGVQESFRSTDSTLANGNIIVRAFCAACGNTEQCFDNISPTVTPNTNDVIATFVDCSTCNGGGNNCDCYQVSGVDSGSVQVGYTDCATNSYTFGNFLNGSTVTVAAGTTPQIVSGIGNLIGPFACIN